LLAAATDEHGRQVIKAVVEELDRLEYVEGAMVDLLVARDAGTDPVTMVEVWELAREQVMAGPQAGLLASG